MKKVFEAKGGIAVTVTTIAKKRYLVDILIPKKSLQKEMSVKNSHFYLKMNTTESLEKEDIVIHLQKEYVIDSSGKITGTKNSSKLKFSGEGYKGSIVLYPKSYIPKGILKQKKVKDESYSKLEVAQKTKKPESKYTNYTHNNAAKPFVGGKVSPK